MKILFVAAEGAPFAKTGGLGDVIGALPKSLVKNGHEVAVILPYYDVVSAKFGNQVEDLGFFYTNVGWRRQYVGIKKIVRDGVTFFFIDNEQYFTRNWHKWPFNKANCLPRTCKDYRKESRCSRSITGTWDRWQP